MDTLHPAAARGFAATSARYAAGRPDYPEAIAGWLRDELRLGPGRLAVDLGAGTGKFLPRLEATGAAVIAVEPVAAMRGELARRHPAIDARDGTAEHLPLEDAAVDAVICAQSFHWFATAAALAEIRRVLRPGGALGLVWNTRDESVPWVAALDAVIAPYQGDTPRHTSGAWRRLFPAAGFGPPRERHFRHTHTGPPERVIVDRLLSVSFVAALPEAEREEVAARIRAVIASSPELAGKATVTFPYDTVAFSCVKLG